MFEYEFAHHARLRTATSVFAAERGRTKRAARRINTELRARDTWR